MVVVETITAVTDVVIVMAVYITIDAMIAEEMTIAETREAVTIAIEMFVREIHVKVKTAEMTVCMIRVVVMMLATAHETIAVLQAGITTAVKILAVIIVIAALTTTVVKIATAIVEEVHLAVETIPQASIAIVEMDTFKRMKASTGVEFGVIILIRRSVGDTRCVIGMEKLSELGNRPDDEFESCLPSTEC